MSGHVGFGVDKVALGQAFPEYFSLPCQSSFHKFLHTHLSSAIRGWYNRSVSDRSTKLNQSHPTPQGYYFMRSFYKVYLLAVII
jgi:hypothetical protein